MSEKRDGDDGDDARGIWTDMAGAQYDARARGQRRADRRAGGQAGKQAAGRSSSSSVEADWHGEERMGNKVERRRVALHCVASRVAINV